MAAVGTLSFLLYARTITYGYVRADDADLIAGNQEFLQDLGNVPRAFGRSYFESDAAPSDQKTYYRPLAIVSFMLDAQRTGTDPAAYHATNVGLHAAAAILLLLLAREGGAAPPHALLASLLFAVHPLDVQAVAWIAGRNDLLLAVFALAALITWSRAGAAGRSLARTGWSSVHVAAFALALFSKESALVLPAAAIAWTVLARGQRVAASQWAALACDAGVAIGWWTLRRQALAGSPSMPADVVSVVAANLPQLLVQAGKAAVPFWLNVSPGVHAQTLLTGIAGTFVLAAAVRMLPRGWAAFAAGWALLFLAPALAVPGLPAYEHRMYLPLVGICAALAHLPLRLEGAQRAGAVLVLVALAGITLTRQPVFANPRAYWGDAARDRQWGAYAHVNLGQIEDQQGRTDLARRYYARALQIDPAVPKARNNLGVLMMKAGDRDGALRQFLLEAEQHPGNADAWYNLGLHAAMSGQEEDARAYWERALAVSPAYLPAREKLAGLRRR